MWVQVPKGPDTTTGPEPGIDSLLLARAGPEDRERKVRANFLFDLARVLGDKVGMVSSRIPKEAMILPMVRRDVLGVVVEVVLSESRAGKKK